MAAPFGSLNLDHLGLVAGMYDELGISEVVDRTIPQDTTQRQVTVGQALKALVGYFFPNARIGLFQNR